MGHLWDTQVHKPDFICDHTPTAGTSPGSPLLRTPICRSRASPSRGNRWVRRDAVRDSRKLRLPPSPPSPQPWPRSPPRSAPSGAAPRGQRARRGAARCGAVSAGRTARPRSYPHPSAFPHLCPHPRPRGGGWLYSPPPSRRCHLLIAAFALTRGVGCVSRELRAPICGVPALHATPNSSPRFSRTRAEAPSPIPCSPHGADGRWLCTGGVSSSEGSARSALCHPPNHRQLCTAHRSLLSPLTGRS